MKILLDARFYGLENGGLGRYSINLIKSLALLDKTNNYSLLLTNKYFDKLVLPDNFKKIRVDIKPYGLSEQILLPLIIWKENPDIVHYMHFNAPLINFKPFIVTIHDMIMHKSKGLESTTLNYKYVFSHAVKNSKTIIVPSMTINNELSEYFKFYKDKIKVVYLGLDYEIQLVKSNVPKNRNFIYVGNAYPHKNLDLLISAVKKAKVKLDISTSKNYFSNKLKVLVNDENAEEYVRVHDFLDDQKVIQLYRDSAAFIYPSLIEGFGFQGLEAIASGTILIASDIPVFREVYKDYAIYFDPKNVDSLVSAINKSVNLSGSERKTIIENAQNYIKKYSWENTAGKTLSLYQEVAVK